MVIIIDNFELIELTSWPMKYAKILKKKFAFFEFHCLRKIPKSENHFYWADYKVPISMFVLNK